MGSDRIMEIFERAERAAKMAAAGGGDSAAQEKRSVDALKQLCEMRFPLRILDTNMGCRLCRMEDTNPSKLIREYSSEVITALLRRGYEDSFHRRIHLNQINAASLKIKKPAPLISTQTNSKKQKRKEEDNPPKPSHQINAASVKIKKPAPLISTQIYSMKQKRREEDNLPWLMPLSKPESLRNRASSAKAYSRSLVKL